MANATKWLAWAKKSGTPREMNGAQLYDMPWGMAGDRYAMDFRFCTAKDGWAQYDTDQDASYFGVWVHLTGFLTITFAEGDLTVTDCVDDAGMRRALGAMAEFHGDPPPAFRTIDADGTLTHHFDERPSL